jgi:GNAT superfamily N-acetyltransferase
VRDADRGDARAIAEFHTACWKQAYHGIVPQAHLDALEVADREMRWRERLAQGTRGVALADLAGKIVGVARSGPAGDGTAPDLVLWTLYVAAKHRGTGLAGVLMDRVRGEAGSQRLRLRSGRIAHYGLRRRKTG